jgi:16S rRNA A1518/A1519 N6-dimethyltransferase RsmA/KsgA/DIM1 with predicted DNA glycosylase/AP lyase activity
LEPVRGNFRAAGEECYPVHHHRPRKRFGQHFLHDVSVVARIVRAIGAKSDDHVVEIGPGLGALTGALLPSCESLDVIELDRDLAAKLTAEHEGDRRLRVHTGDALAFDFRQLVSHYCSTCWTRRRSLPTCISCCSAKWSIG